MANQYATIFFIGPLQEQLHDKIIKLHKVISKNRLLTTGHL